MLPNPQRKLPLHATRPADRTLQGRQLGTLTEQGAVTECEHHGYRRDRADPDACNRASEAPSRQQKMRFECQKTPGLFAFDARTGRLETTSNEASDV
jgi:hypothetical protein